LPIQRQPVGAAIFRCNQAVRRRGSRTPRPLTARGD
jgi:hypothetical protein